jgi:SulP family sulfate permease
VLALWDHVGYTPELGRDHIFATKRIAIATIFERLDRGICASCSVRVFTECQRLPMPTPAPSA